ncbi:MAG: PorP/SprF family type IX secretion system membrane protein [Bacteroidota bacterium]
MKFTLALSLILTATISAFSQQDPLYNLYLFNQAMINPAYNGTYNLTSVTAISRSQWTGIEGAPVTNMLNANTSFRNERLGAGMLVVDDRLGVNNNLEAQAAFSYKLKFKYSQLSFGLQGGIVNYKYNYDQLHLETVDQTLTQDHMPNFTKPTIGAGVFYRSEKYYVGFIDASNAGCERPRMAW